MELKELRGKIDRIDSEILKLLNSRMEFALRTRKMKPGVEDAEREKQVLDAAARHSRGLVRPEFSQKVFGDIIAESKALQKMSPNLAGFQGEHGAYSEVAARKYDGKMVPIPCPEFIDVFDGVAKGQFDCGVVPVENSLAGAVTQVNDLLVETDLKIVGEVKVPVHHCLLALPDTDYRDIKVVYSHPMALSQCRGFIARNKLEPRPYYDTAGAAMMLANERPKAAAAIASKLCAEIYDLDVLKENIEDHESNYTRFVVLAKGGSAAGGAKGDKCSIIFSTAHKAGALFSVLKLFSDAGINLTRIESRPAQKDIGNFAFLLDFQGSDQDAKVAKILENVQKETKTYKFLGCYKEAKA
ncbi:prephenate dehydratase [Candidatus Micrarchaeota archaeon]|nr:prephenate dehydratase [Candidatus Micrarchaeota archaeon]